MARNLSDTERRLVATALDRYAKELSSADETGIEAVDEMVATQARSATELSELYEASTRGSVSLPDNE